MVFPAKWVFPATAKMEGKWRASLPTLLIIVAPTLQISERVPVSYHTVSLPRSGLLSAPSLGTRGSGHRATAAGQAGSHAGDWWQPVGATAVAPHPLLRALRGGAGAGPDDGSEMSEEEADETEENEDEDSDSTSEDDEEGPRTARRHGKRKSSKTVLERIERKAQLNSTYIKELEDEVESLRKKRQEEEQKVAEDEKGLRDSQDTSELVREGEEITKDVREDAGGELLEGADESELSEEGIEESLRLLGSWWAHKNKTQDITRLARQLKAARQQARALELEAVAPAAMNDADTTERLGRFEPSFADGIEDEDEDEDEDEEGARAYKAELESIFGEGVPAKGWLKRSRRGLAAEIRCRNPQKSLAQGKSPYESALLTAKEPRSRLSCRLSWNDCRPPRLLTLNTKHEPRNPKHQTANAFVIHFV